MRFRLFELRVQWLRIRNRSAARFGSHQDDERSIERSNIRIKRFLVVEIAEEQCKVVGSLGTVFLGGASCVCGGPIEQITGDLLVGLDEGELDEGGR